MLEASNPPNPSLLTCRNRKTPAMRLFGFLSRTHAPPLCQRVARSPQRRQTLLPALAVRVPAPKPLVPAPFAAQSLAHAHISRAPSPTPALRNAPLENYTLLLRPPQACHTSPLPGPHCSLCTHAQKTALLHSPKLKAPKPEHSQSAQVAVFPSARASRSSPPSEKHTRPRPSPMPTRAAGNWADLTITQRPPPPLGQAR